VRYPFHQIDAFTTRRFGGNPAAVVLLDRWLPDDVMLAIAAENNLAETAFVLADSGEDPIPLRWFAPTVEIDLCGHATLATGHVLFERDPGCGDVIRFATMSGALSVTRRDGALELDLPARPAEPVPVSDDLVLALGGARPREAWRARDLVAVFEREEEVRALEPDFTRIAALDTFAVCATAPGSRSDYVLRFFVPRAGIDEDPATGSSHCTLVPLWAVRLGRTRLTARQLSVRVGEFTCELRGDRVGVGGGTVEFLRGEIVLENTPETVVSR
jgi:PhzF family phenazine biosynthesis protein